MAGTVNSVLLVDCDSLRQSLAATGGADAAARLAERLDDWLDAIGTGTLGAGDKRIFDAKRCYISPACEADADTFEAAGFFVIRHETGGPADMRLVVDAMDAMMTADTGTEFVILSAAPDLAPLAERLRAGNHRVTIYADDATATAYRKLANAVISAQELTALLSDEDAPPAPAPAEPIDRAKIEAFAREIHAATNIPLFSPRIFADLFRTLSREIATRGYHFQDTAKHVAEALSRAGRTITARQIVFVVKGLALKGHVFSKDDTPERLAEVFREQARYLIGNAGIALSPERDRILTAWIAAPPTVATPAATAARTSRTTARKPAPARPATPPPAKRAEPPAPPEEPEMEEAKPAPEPPPPPPPPPPPAKPTLRTEVQRPTLSRPKSPSLPAKPATPPKPEVKQPTAAELRAAIAARIQAAARQRPLSAKPKEPPPAPPPAPTARPVPPRARAVPEPEPDLDDPIESSILAAIAEAVDVLVEDQDEAREDRRREALAHDDADYDDAEAEYVDDEAEFEPEPEYEHPPEPPEPELPPEESNDLGDEIQRIVASYSRNRNEG